MLLIGGPRLYGAFLPSTSMLLYAAHGFYRGENVFDHRLNTRTVKMCVVNRFLYWNMNYHVEHHIVPDGPVLPPSGGLHEEIEARLRARLPV